MKKLILSAVAICAFTFVNAQDKKSNSGEGFSQGDVYVTGSVGFGSTSKVTAYKTSQVTFSPTVGYFVTENISIGLGLTVANGSVQNTEMSDTNKTNTFGIGVNGRYYFTPASKFSMFLGLGIDSRTDKQTPATGTATKFSSFGLGLEPGINYFVSKNFSIEAKIAALSYRSGKADYDGAENESSFGLGVNLAAINFGVNYKF
jgi:Outer membrane protein beta-barrel domain